MNDEAKTYKTILGCIGVIALIIYGVLTNGYVLSVLWKWFIVPFGAPELTVVQAIGVSIVISSFMPKNSKRDPDYDWVYGTVVIILTPLFTLGFAYIVKLFL